MAAEWKELLSPRNGMLFYRREFEKDVSGIAAWEYIYPKGFITKTHKHSCGHGMFVLEGELATNIGSFEKGSFVWWPKGSVAWHGGGKEDVRVFFFSDGEFDIQRLPEDDKLTPKEEIYYSNVQSIEPIVANGKQERTLLCEETEKLFVSHMSMSRQSEYRVRAKSGCVGIFILRGVVQIKGEMKGAGEYILIKERYEASIKNNGCENAEMIMFFKK